MPFSNCGFDWNSLEAEPVHIDTNHAKYLEFHFWAHGRSSPAPDHTSESMNPYTSNEPPGSKSRCQRHAVKHVSSRGAPHKKSRTFWSAAQVSHRMDGSQISLPSVSRRSLKKQCHDFKSLITGIKSCHDFCTSWTIFFPYHPWDWYIYLHECLILY